MYIIDEDYQYMSPRQSSSCVTERKTKKTKTMQIYRCGRFIDFPVTDYNFFSDTRQSPMTHMFVGKGLRERSQMTLRSRHS